MNLTSDTLQVAWLALGLSLKVALCASLLNAVFGIGLAWLFAKGRWRGRNLLEAILTLPMVLPPTVIGYYLLVLFGHDAALGRFLATYLGVNLIFTWQGAVLAASIVAFPLVFKAALAAFENVDPQFEHAARVLGVSELALFFRVSLPLSWRAILAGLMLGFARAMGEFGATLMIAGSIVGKTQTLALAVYEAVQAGQEQTALFLVGLTSVTSIALLCGAGFLAPSDRNKA